MRKILLTIVALMAIALNVKAGEPLYTAAGTVGVYSDWSTSTCLFESAENVKVEVYSDSIIVKNWCGVEGYDAVAKWDSEGNLSEFYPIIKGEAKPYVYGGYSYVDTGIEIPGYWIIATYLGYYTYVWDGGLLISAYGYKDASYTTSTWGYYYVGWTVPESTGISQYIAAPEADNAPCYNLAGQRVASDTKGILIKNGKKFIQR